MAADLTVHVGSTPDPHRLRPAIEAALAGRATGAGPEGTVGHAVADAVRTATGGRPCR